MFKRKASYRCRSGGRCAAAGGRACGGRRCTPETAARPWRRAVGAPRAYRCFARLSGGIPSVKPGDDFDVMQRHWEETAQIPRIGPAVARSRCCAMSRCSICANSGGPWRRRLQRSANPLQARLLIPRLFSTSTRSRRRAYPARRCLDEIRRRPQRGEVALLIVPPACGSRAGRLGILPDDRIRHYMVTIRQAALGMPDRDYYLKERARLHGPRAKFRRRTSNGC